MLVASTEFSQPAAPGRAMTTMSRVGRSAVCVRKDSLTTRLIRLRCTADRETFRETARPRREYSLVPGAAMTVNQASLRRRPDLNTREKSADESRRRVAGKRCETCEAACPCSPVVPADAASDGESDAPLGAPTGQHKAAILGGHARPEPMSSFASQIARLIRALHRIVSVRGVAAATCKGPPKDGKCYSRRVGVSTDPGQAPAPRSSVDNPGRPL